MEPINEFRDLLLGRDTRDDQLTILRCDHVVPSTNVLAVCLSKGPTNMPLNFSYENRQSKDLVIGFYILKIFYSHNLKDILPCIFVSIINSIVS